MSEMADLTVDDFAAEADALEVRSLELESIDEDEVREPHRHAYHELIWVREGSGRHLIDGEPVDFGPRTLRLFSGGSCSALSVPEADAPRFDALLELLREEVDQSARPESAELRRHLLSAALLWAQRWREAQLEGGGATSADVQLQQRFLETLERDFEKSHEAAHYAAELGVTTGTLSRTLMRLGGRTTKQMILDRVLLEAARLLRFSDLSIKEIAARLGFPDQFAFSKAFKRQRGEAPLDFRNRL